MKWLLLHPEARAELADATARYERTSPEVAAEFVAKAEAAFLAIQEHPQRMPPHRKSVYRKCMIGRFPYTIFFEEYPAFVWVAAISHQAREPEYWIGREVGN